MVKRVRKESESSGRKKDSDVEVEEKSKSDNKGEDFLSFTRDYSKPSCSKEANNDESEKYRMWAAISFAVMLLVVGIPLWWKTTEVQRAALPYDEIHSLNPSVLEIVMNVHVYCEYPSRTNDLIKYLEKIASNQSIYLIEFKPYKIALEEASYEIIDNSSEYTNQSPGDILLAEVTSLPDNKTILISNNRVIYFTKTAENNLIGFVLKELFLRENDLRNKITSIVSPQSLTGKTDNLDSLRASLSYDIVFTVINSDPEQVNLVWDVAADINHYFKPLLDQLSLISNHFVKSQWLYFVELGQTPKSDNFGTYSLTYSQLPHIITPLEKKLGSGISKNPCVHLVLYTVSCRFSPMTFLTFSGEQINSMISPQWGAVQILNPSLKNCLNSTLLVPDSKKVMSTFTSQFHHLLGVRDNKDLADFDIGVMKISGSLLRSWEIDNLYKIRTVEQITSASLTLQSLSKLLEEISNIVINEDVAKSINDAVVYLKKATEALQNAELIDALKFSRIAYSASETAFSDPSLLALLYFPDDQKYAVYIPLFLPIMIPVLMSLNKIKTWLVYGTVATTEDKFED